MTHIKTALALAAVAATAAVPATSVLAAASTTPRLLDAELVTAPEINPGTVAVVFRASHTLARGSNGGTLKGRAGVRGGTSSIGTVHGANGHACYVAYQKADLTLGHQYKATITIGHIDYHRTLTLKHPHRVADFGADLGC